MKDENLNILSPRTSNPLLYNIYNFYIFIIIWLIRVILPLYYFGNVMSQNLGSLTPPPLVTQCHTSAIPSAPPLTCDVIYGCPLKSDSGLFRFISFSNKIIYISPTHASLAMNNTS